MNYFYHKDGTLPQNGEFWVFGSNEAGVHGAGAAEVAMKFFGAKWGVARGFTGRCYAIPTKDKEIITLPLAEVRYNVREFVLATKNTFDKDTGLLLQYFVTRVGCVLAGFHDSQVAPLFKGAASTCNFPEAWRQYLE
jgi:hypothetical protein